MARSWKTGYRGFTFAETLVTIALLVLSAGLATQLLFSSMVFTQSHDAQQKRLRSLLSLKTGLLATTSRIQPPSWAPQEGTFVQKGFELQMDYWKGTAGAQASIWVDEAGFVRWRDPEASMEWGPWAGCQVSFWKVEDRIVGLAVTMTDGGQTRTLRFPWGAWSL